MPATLSSQVETGGLAAVKARFRAEYPAPWRSRRPEQPPVGNRPRAGRQWPDLAAARHDQPEPPCVLATPRTLMVPRTSVSRRASGAIGMARGLDLDRQEAGSHAAWSLKDERRIDAPGEKDTR
jgi:hypothetical protein